MYLNRAFKYAEFLFSDTFRSARTPDSPLSLYEGWSGTLLHLCIPRPHTSSIAFQGPSASLPIFCIQTRRPFLSRKSSTDRPPNSCSRNNNLIEKAWICDLCLPHLLAILIHLSPLHQRLCQTCHRNFSLVIICPCVDCLLSICLNLKLPEITKVILNPLCTLKRNSLKSGVSFCNCTQRNTFCNRNTCCDYQSYFTIVQNVYLINCTLTFCWPPVLAL